MWGVWPCWPKPLSRYVCFPCSLWSKKWRGPSGEHSVTSTVSSGIPFCHFFFFFFSVLSWRCKLLLSRERKRLFLGMLISRLSSFQSPGLAGSIFQDLQGGSWGPFVSPARNVVLGKWQELWEGFLISVVVFLAFKTAYLLNFVVIFFPVVCA